jgi:osmotically inducible protein OsmC
VGPREGGGSGIAVKMQVKVPALPADAKAIVQEAHKICRYSQAMLGNIDFTHEVEGA